MNFEGNFQRGILPYIIADFLHEIKRILVFRNSDIQNATHFAGMQNVKIRMIEFLKRGLPLSNNNNNGNNKRSFAKKGFMSKNSSNREYFDFIKKILTNSLD